MRRGHGMTLVELICVMHIVSVLSVNAVVRLDGVTTSAHRTSVRLALAYCPLKRWADRDSLPGLPMARWISIPPATRCTPTARIPSATTRSAVCAPGT
ncbi:MAG: type II secretion system protein [Betaproteobacteria bacterium]|nr:type II secretion system protein [Betaproteobacteria bacterium]